MFAVIKLLLDTQEDEVERPLLQQWKHKVYSVYVMLTQPKTNTMMTVSEVENMNVQQLSEYGQAYNQLLNQEMHRASYIRQPKEYTQPPTIMGELQHKANELDLFLNVFQPY